VIGNILGGAHMYFAEPTALSGSLVETLKEIKPTFFFSVPRVWEKIDEKMKSVAAENGWLKTQIGIKLIFKMDYFVFLQLLFVSNLG